ASPNHSPKSKLQSRIQLASRTFDPRLWTLDFGLVKMPESWTVLRLLAWTTEYLKSHGSESPRLDAEVLLAHARGCERIMLYAAFDQGVDRPTRRKLREVGSRLAEG